MMRSKESAEIRNNPEGPLTERRVEVQAGDLTMRQLLQRGWKPVEIAALSEQELQLVSWLSASERP